MKKSLLSLTLLSSAALSAGEEIAANDCCDPCSPCCLPQPKPCIDCECYVPPYYDLQCDWGVFLTGDFLYWYASEANLFYAIEQVGIDLGVEEEEMFFGFFPSKFASIDVDWDPAFRVGIGWNDDCDGWDFYLHWTYFHNTAKDSISTQPFSGPFPDIGQNGLIDPWGQLQFTQPPLVDRIDAKWKFRFNNIDFEIGRKYWLSKCFTLRPFAAIRGTWTRTEFNVTANPRNFTDTFMSLSATASYSTAQSYRNENWGVGFLGGLQPNWYFSSCFSLYAGMDVALLWGKRELKFSESAFQTTIFDQDITRVLADYDATSKRSATYGIQAILDTEIGIRWENTWCCDRYRTMVNLGWEHHILFDHNMRVKMNLSEFVQPLQTAVIYSASLTSTWNSVGFGGFVLRLRFDF